MDSLCQKMEDNLEGNSKTDALQNLVEVDPPNTEEVEIVHVCEVTKKEPSNKESYEIYAMKLNY